MRTSRLGVGLLAVAAVTLAACSTPDTTPGASGGGGGTIVVALASDPGTIDPTMADTFDARVVFTSFCEKLYDANDQLQAVPQLAAGLPKTSADGLTVTIPVRTGIKFNDGTPFNAAAVKTTLDRDITFPGSARAREIAAVKTVTVLNPTTVQIKLKYPFSPLVAQLADRAGLIMSPTALKKEGSKFASDPVCVGPFKFSSRTEGTQLSFVKSNDYYNASKVKAAGVTYKIITDPTTRADNLQSGDVQAAEQLDTTDIPRLKGDSSLKIEAISAISYEGISINVSNAGGVDKPAGHVSTPLANSPELRKAFEMALDRNAMNKAVYNGDEAVDCLPFPIQSQYRPANPNCTPYNPTAAKQIVASSGVKMPVPVQLMIPANSGVDRLAQVIQSMEDKAGFAVTIKSVEFGSSLAAARAGKFDAFLIGWSGRLDPDGDLSDLVTSGGSNNFSGLQDPQLDNLVTASASASGVPARKAEYAKTLARLQQIRSNIYLYHDRWYLGLSAKLTGVGYNTDGIPRFTTASLQS
ncbi:MAG TPA: ABC transporter substrate-binding protein [Pseudonocardiaceae bacterium]|jgi:peptide/nickel transport system substrate-binding protein|nr:ABC transporter substrate-binding protein [Pseudonocardiaceae bacterium]